VRNFSVLSEEPHQGNDLQASGSLLFKHFSAVVTAEFKAKVALEALQGAADDRGDRDTA